MTLDALKASIRQHQSPVAVIGLGYVGLPLLIRLSAVGFPTIGIDTDPAKVESLHQGRSYLSTVGDGAVARALKQGMRCSSDAAAVSEAQVIILCVPTPLGAHREPDLSYVRQTIATIIPHLSRDILLILESTTYPGTTEEELVPPLLAAGFSPGKDIAVIYAPEREDPGSRHPANLIPKVLGGITATCSALGCAFYEQLVERVVPVSSPRAAEMTKLLENIHRAVNIGLVNEMKVVADAMGIDIHEVIAAAASKPFGFTPYYPGPGLGGHCIPIDPFYLTWKAKEYGVHTRFIELAGEINHAMPAYVVSKLRDALNARGQAVKDSRILILGLAYKKNVDDTRESPALAIIDQLLQLGAKISYHDPYVKRCPQTRRWNFDIPACALSAETLASQDAVLLVTDHDQLDYALIAREAALIIDTRGRYPADQPGIVRA
ncbi:MAG: nucleotide sugar dehydrogenase [Planctomycetota bacterium]|nr:MAG: nucleotide sugar dehydrogenase [Planctomycetota bacterium]